MITILHLEMTYGEWRKYLTPFLKNGVLKDIHFKDNKFTELPVSKLWLNENINERTLLGFPMESCIIEDNIFEGIKI